ncbi:CDP-diacylglycerol--glycerol-3-phosphate 3-phosphatidyltransferase [Mycoplasma sp. Ms02]|uniref:CDP-diacylglycerol--glycerol-3-phosphate 3-phosphatidyltransferase n=1 Tax=Mycoplasma sp. Ms02 TaxID=353851 RepID=UPI001C890EF5|nr:CDP-diacylglycerol--glycerol-3-phosphate 3-phosphatidyltransferase [Mycoplasma sp. Ms02]QZE12181.1 CDP-diacylglycerol--glycerol-3-phosphate 3-phosphatidyltransferase [Mycoplasma sp. Ms02]
MKFLNFFKGTTLPNKLTIIRILLVFPFIFFLWLSNFFRGWGLPFQIVFGVIALFIFIAAMITDYFDGKIAREKKLASNFGKLWDPIADKLITTVALSFLLMVQIIPLWLFLVFILRDIVVAGARTVMVQHNISVAADKMGKIKTVLMTIGIIICLIYEVTGINWLISYTWFIESMISYIISIPLMVACVFNLISGYNYVRKVSVHLL